MSGVMNYGLLAVAATLAGPCGAALERLAVPAYELQSARKCEFDIRMPERTAFERGETNALLSVSIDNRTSEPLVDAQVGWDQFCADGRIGGGEKNVVRVDPAASVRVCLEIETRIRPGWHSLRVTLRGRLASGRKVECLRVLRYGVGARFGDCLRTVMWGYKAPESALSEFGFTHGYYFSKSVRAPVTEAFDRKPIMDIFDRALVSGLRIIRVVGPSYYPENESPERYYRLWRNGKHGKTPQPEVGNPVLVDRFRGICESDADIFGGHPAFQGVLPYSEKRDRAFPSFNTEHLRYRAETGRDVPPEVCGKTFSLALAEKRFPTGVVPEDDEIYRYYHWYLKGGDGWPAFLAAGLNVFRSRIRRPDFQSMWDPAVRAAPIWGSGGGADMLNQWCYAVPEPMNVAGPCEEVLAMAEGTPGQKAAIMTQLICYRSQMAPTNAAVASLPGWARRFPQAAFPTIPPDVLQEATWSMIAKPVSAIMYHGWGTVYDTHEKKRYCFTNPSSAERLRYLLKDVVAPIGPVLKRLGRKTPRIAVLESATTCAMGGPASWGWKAPAITMLQRARLDPRVVYEETILRDNFRDIDVLYAPQCRFLTAAMVDRIRGFQKKGGILVADDQLVSVLKPDVKVPAVSFDAPPEYDYAEYVDAMEAARDGSQKTRSATVRAKSFMHSVAGELRAELAGRGYRPNSDSSSPEIVVYAREWKGVPYLFAINDRRTFGDYVGQWGLVMEQGMPGEGWVSIRDSEHRVAAVYELSRGERVSFRRDGGVIKVAVQYETNDGRFFVFLPSEIASTDVVRPSRIRRGGKCEVKMTVKGPGGTAIPALLPVEIRLFDAAGREIDGGGYACAEGGVAIVEFQTNIDDAEGAYRLLCVDRASGLRHDLKIEQE